MENVDTTEGVQKEIGLRGDSLIKEILKKDTHSGKQNAVENPTVVPGDKHKSTRKKNLNRECGTKSKQQFCRRGTPRRNEDAEKGNVRGSRIKLEVTPMKKNGLANHLFRKKDTWYAKGGGKDNRVGTLKRKAPMTA